MERLRRPPGERVHPRRDARQHHAVLAHRHGGFFRPAVLGEHPAGPVLVHRVHIGHRRRTGRVLGLPQGAASAVAPVGGEALYRHPVLERAAEGRSLRRLRASGHLRRRGSRVLPPGPVARVDSESPAQNRRFASTGTVLRADSTSAGSISTTSRPGFSSSWSTIAPSGPATALAPIPVGARPASRPTVVGSAWSQAATNAVESSARARTSRSHCSRLPGPAPQDAGATMTVAPRLPSSWYSPGNRRS